MERLYGGNFEPLGDREVGVIAASSERARDGHVLEVAGMDLTNYRRNPVVLHQHNPESVIGVCSSIGVEGDLLVARIRFADPGVSAVADQICSLMKGAVMRAISVGFDPQETEPLDPRKPRGGLRITRSELLELSAVAVGADPNAVVITRALNTPSLDRIFRRLAIPQAAIERAAARIPRRRDGAPLSHAGHVWALQEQRRLDDEARFSREARQAEAEELRRIGESYGAEQHRPRRYGVPRTLH